MSLDYGIYSNKFSSFSDDEKLQYALKIALSRVQTDVNTAWFNEPNDYTPKQPNELYKNKIPSMDDIKDYFVIDPDYDGQQTSMVTDIKVKAILGSTNWGPKFTLAQIYDKDLVRKPEDWGDLTDADFVDGASKMQIKKLGRNMFTRYSYWSKDLTGQKSNLEGTGNSPSKGDNSGTNPDMKEPLNAFVTYDNNGGLSDERVFANLPGDSGSAHEIFYNKLLPKTTTNTSGKGIELSIIAPGDILDINKAHPFLKLCLQVPTYTTRGSQTISKHVGSETSGNVGTTDNIGFHNPLMKNALGDTNGFVSGVGYQIAGWKTSGTIGWADVTTAYGDTGKQNILYFLSNPGFIIVYGVKNIDYAEQTSRSYPPMVSFMKYTGETFADGIISQGATDPVVAEEKDLFINTTGGVLKRFTNSAWVSLGGDSLEGLTTGGTEQNTAIGNSALVSNTTGSDNTAIGYYADVGSPNLTNATAIGANATVLKSHTIRLGDSRIENVITNGSGYFDGITIGKGSGTTSNDKRYSTAIGFNALIANTTGSENTAIGYNALAANLDGKENTAIGFKALAANLDGKENTAIGFKALAANTTGYANTSVGNMTLKDNKTGHNNISIGYNALRDNDAGDYNMAIGTDALLMNSRIKYWGESVRYTNTDAASDNMAIGYETLKENRIGYGNIAIGNKALNKARGSSNNTAIGYMAINGKASNIWSEQSGGSNNVAVGSQTMLHNQKGFNNVAIGMSAIRENINGDSNVAIGCYAMQNNSEGSKNVAVGYESLYYAGGTSVSSTDVVNECTAIGYEALFNNQKDFNTAIGCQALKSNKTGENNTASGYQALMNNITGNWNTASGWKSLFLNKSGDYNTGLGTASLHINSDGDSNTGIGYTALFYNKTAKHNTGIGHGALFYSESVQTAWANAKTTPQPIPNNNTAVGYMALFHNRIGSNNTAVGYNSGPTEYSSKNKAYVLDNTTCLGNGAVVHATNTIQIGNSSVALISGQVEWSTSSDKRIKNNIQDSNLGLDFITKLRPVKYNMVNPCDYPEELLECCFTCENPEPRPDDNVRVYDGLIAQEVESVLSTLNKTWSGHNICSGEGKKQSISYSTLTVPLIKSVQELNDKITSLETQNSDFNNKIATLETENTSLKARLDDIEKKLSDAGM